MDKKKTALHAPRRAVQLLSALGQNPRLSALLSGKIYQRPLKRFCVPGLNCYSCPAAVGACPLGALQAVNGSKKRFSFYLVGFLLLTGLLLGRFVCGWLCLFGLVQELLYALPTKKLTVGERLDRPLRKLKYLLLALFVFLLPLLTGSPWFCKYVCPAGTLEGALPLLAADEALRSLGSWLLGWKLLVLGTVLLSSVFIYRPFCKYLCPLGAFYGLVQRFGLPGVKTDGEKCIDCGNCVSGCPMGVDIRKTPDSAECIRCGKCRDACPTGAIRMGRRG